MRHTEARHKVDDPFLEFLNIAGRITAIRPGRRKEKAGMLEENGKLAMGPIQKVWRTTNSASSWRHSAQESASPMESSRLNRKALMAVLRAPVNTSPSKPGAGVRAASARGF